MQGEIDALFDRAEEAEARLAKLQEAARKHLEPRYAGNGMSVACCDEALSAALAEGKEESDE
jgi:hypothetical protein